MNWAITLIIFNSSLNNETKNNNYLIVKLSSFFKRQTNGRRQRFLYWKWEVKFLRYRLTKTEQKKMCQNKREKVLKRRIKIYILSLKYKTVMSLCIHVRLAWLNFDINKTWRILKRDARDGKRTEKKKVTGQLLWRLFARELVNAWTSLGWQAR